MKFSRFSAIIASNSRSLSNTLGRKVPFKLEIPRESGFSGLRVCKEPSPTFWNTDKTSGRGFSRRWLWWSLAFRVNRLEHNIFFSESNSLNGSIKWEFQMGTYKVSADCAPVMFNEYVQDVSSPNLSESWDNCFVISVILIFLWVIKQYWLKPNTAWMMLQKDNLYSVTIPTFVACLLLHLTCAKLVHTSMVGLWCWQWPLRGVWGLALQKEMQMFHRTCAKWCLKADSSCPGLVCTAYLLNTQWHHRLIYLLFQGAGTDDGTLIRVIVSRSEVDLNLIKPEFKRIAGKSLSSMISVSRIWIWWFLAIACIPNLSSTVGCFRGCLQQQCHFCHDHGSPLLGLLAVMSLRDTRVWKVSRTVCSVSDLDRANPRRHCTWIIMDQTLYPCTAWSPRWIWIKLIVLVIPIPHCSAIFSSLYLLSLTTSSQCHPYKSK